GCPLIFLSPAAFSRDPLRWLRTVSEHRAYISGGPTFAYRLCAERATPDDVRQLDLSGWQVAYIGAEPVSAAVLDRFAKVFAPAGFRREAFYPCYVLAAAALLVTGRFGLAAPAFRAEALEQGRAEPDADGRTVAS